LRWLGRAGFVAEGVMYMLVGALALAAAFEPGDHPQGSQGALAKLGQAPWGHAMFAVLAAGLVMFVLWQAVLAVLDPGHRGDRRQAKRVLVRLGCLFNAAVHAALVGTAAWRLLILDRSAGNNGQSQVYWTTVVMRSPLGRWLIAAIGVGIAVFGLFQLYDAAVRRPTDRIDLARTKLRGALIALGMLGFVARGVVFTIIGGFLVDAAWWRNAHHAIGIAGALAALRRQAYGPWLLGAVAVGLMAYGIVQIARARFGEIRADRAT
jgi:MFS family permease